MTQMEVQVRRLSSQDLDFLRAMFVHTICWRERDPAQSLEQLLAVPDFARYMVGWGRPGDDGVVAVLASGERLGAAWYRLFEATDHGYGFVSPSVPEIGIGVRSEHRGRGVGERLMRALIRLAVRSGFPALSLSVDVENVRAVRLYEALGFKRVAQVETAWTMLRSLSAGSEIARD